jgi:hypothetical protein
MRHLRADLKNIRPLAQVPYDAQLLYQDSKVALYYTYDYYQGQVTWIMVNKTDTTLYVSLLRGASLNINDQNATVPSYIFGNAFAEVYFANGLSSYINDLNNIPLYSLAVLKSPSGQTIVGFVFVLPPNSVISAPEYGFIGLQSLNGQLLEVTPENDNLYAIIYDYAEIIEYEQEAGVQVQAPPDPYAVYSYQFSISDIGTIITPRVIFKVPQSDVNAITGLINDIKKFFHKL